MDHEPRRIESHRREYAFLDAHAHFKPYVFGLGRLLDAWPELESAPPDVPDGVLVAYAYLRTKLDGRFSDSFAWHHYFNATAQGSD